MVSFPHEFMLKQGVQYLGCFYFLVSDNDLSQKLTSNLNLFTGDTSHFSVILGTDETHYVVT